MEMANKGDYKAMLVNMIGVTTRLPGRFLASEDEFFKVISKRKVLYREAYRRQMMTYEEALRGGIDKTQAMEMAKKKYTEVVKSCCVIWLVNKSLTFDEVVQSMWKDSPH